MAPSQLVIDTNLCFVYTYHGQQDKVNNCSSGLAQCNADQECRLCYSSFMTDLVLLAEQSSDLSFEAKEKGCHINGQLAAE